MANEVVNNEEMMNEIQEAMETANDLTTVTLPDEKFKLDYKAVAIGACGALLVGAAIYGGYRGYQYWKKNKKEKKA